MVYFLPAQRTFIYQPYKNTQYNGMNGTGSNMRRKERKKPLLGKAVP
jgi:hypothetical protein